MSEILVGEFALPIFPLPNVVFFPKTRLPLHIFEPRYRSMVADALEGERRIGILLLQPGWEVDYLGAPPVHTIGTLGVIEQAAKLDDGRFNIVLDGLVRFRILEEVSQRPYRVARVVAAPEAAGAPELAWASREWLVELSLRYLEYMPMPNQVPELKTAAFEELTNALVMSLALEPEEKQALLKMDDLVARAERVGELLHARLETLHFLAPFRRGTDPANN